MSGASYEDRNGERIQLPANGPNGTLFNGGQGGWGRQKWDVAVHSKNSITFVLFDRSWNGFPGIGATCLTHTVTPYEWHVGWGVTPLKAPAPIALSQTVFFNLDGFQVDEAQRATGINDSTSGTVLDHRLHMPSSGLRFELNEHGVPTGGFRPNTKSGAHDFWSTPSSSSSLTGARTIRDSLSRQYSRVLPASGAAACQGNGRLRGCSGGYDETFVISHPDTGNKQNSLAAVLSSPQSGVSLSIFTDRDALHVHTWNEEDGT